VAGGPLTSHSAADTGCAAEAVARELGAGDVVLLSGEVGTGKTTFVRAACRALGVRETVTSPSFTIGRRYEGAMPVSHVDLYRLETLATEEPGLFSDYLSGDAVTFVEWPDAALAEIEPPRVVLRLRLVHLGGDMRAVEVDGEPHLVAVVERALSGGQRAR
jgi:tRNA threonylcarbamoyladenosine biosynthesis protein TsaE